MDTGSDTTGAGRSSGYSLTTAGRTTLVVSAAALIAGWLTGIIESYALSAAAAVALALSVARAVVTRRGLSISRRITPQRVTAGSSFTVALDVRNHRRRTSPPVMVHESVGGIPVLEEALAPLEPSASVTIPFSVPTIRRGSIEIDTCTYSLLDPFGLVERRTMTCGPQELVVWPLTWSVTVPADVSGAGSGESHTTAGSRTSESDEFAALAEYAPGDDRRHIHWPSSARAGRLMVRRFETQRPRATHVVLERYADNPAAFEVAVSICASVMSALDSPADSVSFSTATIDHDMVRSSEPTIMVRSDEDMTSVLDRLAVTRPEMRLPRDDGSGDRAVDRRISAIRGAIEHSVIDRVGTTGPIDRILVIGPSWPVGHRTADATTTLQRFLPGSTAVRLITVPANASMASTDEHIAQNLIDGGRKMSSMTSHPAPVPPFTFGVLR